MKNHTGMNIGFLKSLSTLLTTKSLTQISVNEICKETGLSRRTFYNYFSSKEDFLKNSIFIFLDEVTKILYTDLSFSAPVIVEVLTYLQKNQDITRALALHYPDNLPIIKEYVIDIVLSSKKINKQKLKEAYQLPEDFALNVYVISVISVVFVWIRTGFHESPEEIATYIKAAVKL